MKTHDHIDNTMQNASHAQSQSQSHSGESTITDLGSKKSISKQRTFILIISTLVLGIVAGVSSGLLSLLLKVVENFFLGFVESSSMPDAFNVNRWRRFISLTIGGIIAAVIWWLLRNKARHVPSVKKSVKGAQMPFWQTIVHVVTQIFLVGTGGSVGREVAPREAGALFGGLWFQLMHRWGLPSEDRELLVAAAAGAGFAGVYISPLTGALFSVEILLKRVNAETVAVSLAMSSIASYVGGLIHGTDAYYAVPNSPFSWQILAFSIVASPLIGIAGGYFSRASSWAETKKTTGMHILWQLPLVALLTGVVALWGPEVMGNGRALAQTAMNYSAENSGVTVVIALAVLACAKALLTTFTLKAGASGGTLTPSIGIGAALGAILGIAWNYWIPGTPLWQCAMVGAVALLSASQRAPLMALMMVMEVSHLPIVALGPLGMATSLGVATSNLAKTTAHHNKPPQSF